MADIFTREKRSWIMSKVRGKDTKIEKIVEDWLESKKVEFKKHYSILGKPDFVIPKKKVAIFVDGDFWHGYRMGPKKLSRMKEFWREKITKNKKRDFLVKQKLRKDGWKVIRIWEHELENGPKKALKNLKSI